MQKQLRIKNFVTGSAAYTFRCKNFDVSALPR